MYLEIYKDNKIRIFVFYSLLNKVILVLTVKDL